MDLISCHQKNPLDGYFNIKKACELLARKNYWPTFYYNVKAYIKRCNIGLDLKVVYYKPYNDLQLLLKLTNQ